MSPQTRKPDIGSDGYKEVASVQGLIEAIKNAGSADEIKRGKHADMLRLALKLGQDGVHMTADEARRITMAADERLRNRGNNLSVPVQDTREQPPTVSIEEEPPRDWGERQYKD